MQCDSSFVAVSQRVVEVSSRGEIRDCLDQQWSLWLQSLGLTCVPVPNCLPSADQFLEQLRPVGIVLTGGNNLAASVYEGVAPGVPIGDAFECRDRTERELVQFAQRKRVPLLGCCHGMQFLQAFFGGRLAPLANSPVTHVNQNHLVEITHDRFRELVASSKVTVNSFHNYGFRREALPSVLTPFAVSPTDNTVEGFFHRDFPIVGMMWHPERKNPAAEFDRAVAARLFFSSQP